MTSASSLAEAEVWTAGWTAVWTHVGVDSIATGLALANAEKSAALEQHSATTSNGTKWFLHAISIRRKRIEQRSDTTDNI